jgi:uncharacterized protein YceH (UPF0502 family)
MVERRTLGVLVEKAKTTPEAYPLSLNALVTGSNQKSNRDPILDLTDADIEDALAECQKTGLVTQIIGGRVERWRHNLYDVWRVNKVELAVLTELLLRGPQTEGELRGRASRMEPIADLDALRAVLKPLAERKLVVYLTEEGKRGTTVTHGFHDAAELERLRKHHAGGAASGSAGRSRTDRGAGADCRARKGSCRPSWYDHWPGGAGECVAAGRRRGRFLARYLNPKPNGASPWEEDSPRGVREAHLTTWGVEGSRPREQFSVRSCQFAVSSAFTDNRKLTTDNYSRQRS